MKRRGYANANRKLSSQYLYPLVLLVRKSLLGRGERRDQMRELTLVAYIENFMNLNSGVRDGRI